MTNTYALYVEPDAPDSVLLSIVDFLKTDERVSGWLNHLPSLYLLTSESDAATISKLVSQAIKPWAFLVVRVDPSDLQVWLPDRAWPWIQRRYA